MNASGSKYRPPRLPLWLAPLAALGIALGAGATTFGQEGDEPLSQARAAYKRRHLPAESKRAVDLYEKAIAADASYASLWEGARAVSYLGQNSWAKRPSRQLKTLFKKGLSWAERSVKVRPNGAEGHYYTAVLLGLYARERTFVHQMASAADIRRAGERAMRLDPTVECGGPLHLLGLYYRHLPTAFGGDNHRARKLLEKAVRVCPGDPGLRYDLAECLHTVGHDARAKREAQWAIDHPPRSAAERRGYKQVKRNAEELLREID